MSVRPGTSCPAERSFTVDGAGGSSIDRVQVTRTGAVRVATSGGAFIVHSSEFDRLTLEVLKDLFDSGRFEHDAGFRDWLTEHNLATEFFSY